MEQFPNQRRDGIGILRLSLSNLNGHGLPSEVLKERVPLGPVAEAAVSIDVAGLSNIDKSAAPGIRTALRKR